MYQPKIVFLALALTACLAMLVTPACAQIGRRFPSEKRIVPDPVTGVPLTFLTSTMAGDRKIYQTHSQWTADGKWVVFQSRRAQGQAFAVHEASGDIVQITEHGFTGMLCVAQKSMRLIHLRPAAMRPAAMPPTATAAGDAPVQKPALPTYEVVAIDLERVFADSAAGTMRSANEYEQVLGTIPAGMATHYELALDATEGMAYFSLTREAAAPHLAPGTRLESAFGPRNMGAGPGGIGSVNLATGEIATVVAVPFQVGHVQTNPWVPGEIVFAWETGGKAPQRTWSVLADGSGLRPLYREAEFDWVTHEAIISRDEVAMALMGHRAPGTIVDWGPSGTREHATGLGVLNLRTREFRIAGQTSGGSGLWHVHGSSDGRWAVGDTFAREIYLIDRHTGEMTLLSAGHKSSAADHPHPTFSPDGTRIEIQSAMLSEDDRSMNICIIPVPDAWLKRTNAGSVAGDQPHGNVPASP